jgi:hypothetical protein
VWSPAGGWWPEPAQWRANTALALAGAVGLSSVIVFYSSKLEVRARARAGRSGTC